MTHMPQIPPSWLELDRRLPAERRTLVLRQRGAWLPADRYVPWDVLRTRVAPAGFSTEEWWYVLKLGRSATYRGFGLVDKVGRPFVFGQPDELLAALHQIDRGSDGAALPASATDLGARERHILDATVEEAIASAQLAGAATTRDAAKEMVRAGRLPRSGDEQAVVNLCRTLPHLRESGPSALSPDTLFDLHRRLTEATFDDPTASGRLRRSDEPAHSRGFNGAAVPPPPASELPRRIEALCAFANAATPAEWIHPLVRGLLLHFWVMHDRPFVDGNGRMARVLFLWAMHRAGYPLFEYLSVSAALARAPMPYTEVFLHVDADDNDVTYFLLQQTRAIHDAARAFRAAVEHEKVEWRSAHARLTGLRALNPRQQALLLHALREPGTAYEIIRHQRSHGVTHQTARTDLFDLVERGLLTSMRAGRRFRFHAPADLEQRLSP